MIKLLSIKDYLFIKEKRKEIIEFAKNTTISPSVINRILSNKTIISKLKKGIAIKDYLEDVKNMVLGFIEIN